MRSSFSLPAYSWGMTNEPLFGVPSITSRQSRSFNFSQISGYCAIIVRATKPPIECARNRMGRLCLFNSNSTALFKLSAHFSNESRQS